MEIYIHIAAVALIAFYAGAKLRHGLQMLQQNSYRVERYWRWLKANVDTAGVDYFTDALMAGVLGGFYNSRWAVYAIGAVGLIALYKGVRQLLRRSKKPLVFTARAWRLYIVALVVVAACVAPLAVSGLWWWAALAAMVLVAAAPFVMIVAVWILSPLEAAVNRRYVDDARRILASMPGLRVIGITGSYGKTSTKHYLYRILSEQFNVVMTPGSFNTTLGVVRTIREQLKPYTEVFIVEMGAKQPGDLAEICELVHPSVGIITAVGEQHLETFKTIENVQRTKFELIDSLPPDGIAILNDDFEYIARRPVTNVSQVLRYTSADVSPAPFETRLLGRYNLTNLYAAWLAGRALGMTDERMRYAIRDIRPVEHRLSMTMAGGLRIIDDAFNSNPHGAAMALEVLASFTDGRRIIVTPGMIELGEKQFDYNREFGRQMASSCDYAIIVGELNREAILAGLADGAGRTGESQDAPEPAPEIYTARTFPDAVARVRTIARPGDTILYENDLPDTFK
jgi:UDP-N-acetylmuramoyl-tripeptide--D-alanyl-D-alanine ligase